VLRRAVGFVRAVDGVSIAVHAGETVGLVGESGSGKSTLGELIVALQEPTGGRILYEGADVAGLGRRDLKAFRRRAQMVFQDPYGTLNPRFTTWQTVVEPVIVAGEKSPAQQQERVRLAVQRAGLVPDHATLDAYPHELSGGQRQRVAIARAIVMEPSLLVADEPVSMLDVSIRSGILNLLLELRTQLGLTIIYISHDLASVRSICDRIAIMYLGKVVEIGPTAEIFANPRHPYTKALLAAIPEPDPEKMVPRDLPRGEIPDAAEPPLGCSFHPRCPEAVRNCGWESRDLRALIEEHWTRSGAAYDEEQRVLGDLEHLDTPTTSATLGAGGGSAVRAILDRIRAEDTEEPLWSGVTSIEDAGPGVVVHFQPADSPPLRRAGGVDVACVLYPDES
jgi:peptide/nickel transport system ATP-binding protein